MADRKFARIAVPLAGIAVVAALPGTVHAQVAPKPRKEIRLDLVTRYDENVIGTSQAVANARSLSTSDVSLSPVVTVNIEKPFGPHRVGLIGEVGYNFYRRNTELNRERINLNADSDFRVGPCFVSPYVRFSRNQTDLGDIAFIGPALLSVKNTETVQTYGSELACGRATGLRPVVGYEYEKGRNSNDLRKQSDYTSNMYSVGLRYVGPTFGVITLYARRRKTEYDALPLPNFGADRYRTTEYGVSYERNIGSRYQVAGSIGRTKVDSDNPLIGDRSGVTWNLRGTALFGSRLQVTLETANEFRNSLSSDATVNRMRSYSAQFNYAMTEVLRFNGLARFEKNTRDYSFVPPPGTLFNDRRRIYRLGATYDYGRRTQFGVFVGREERNGNGTLFDYSANNAGMSVGVRF
ncbi:MAG TPA: hypothetical protein VF440_04980 [Novosphingobium sp.]